MTTPLLFGKRLPAAPSIAEQYVGTDTELDPKAGAPVALRPPHAAPGT